ncbi:MAG: hypothetical protein ACLQBB_08625 [Solirubrobacteraceae bacterium]
MRAIGSASRRPAVIGLASILAVVCCTAAVAASTGPSVTTEGATHARGTSAQLEGVIKLNGVASASYVFQYGPTVAYGSQTKPATVTAVPNDKPIKVGQPVTGLLAGYHYRILLTYTNASGVPTLVPGGDKSFTGLKSDRLAFSVGKGKESQITVSYGGTAELTGSLTGKGNANLPLSLQATPFPFTGPFATLGGTVLSGRTGSFLFEVAHLTRNTEFRVLTVATRPLYSPIMTVHVSPRIVLHVRAGKSGLYRLYGTVTPAGTGAAGVAIQLLEPQKPGSKRSGPRARTVGTAALKRARSSFSRFSLVVKLSGTFHYRAYVSMPKGPLVSGHSNDVLIRAPKTTGTKHKKTT